MDMRGLLDPNFKRFAKEGGYDGHVNLAGGLVGRCSGSVLGGKVLDLDPRPQTNREKTPQLKMIWNALG